ncbi:MAG: hypothetical protein JKY81_01680 [Colwellia sp.]|nr:hypothetical protein [Colwellia sp.]
MSKEDKCKANVETLEKELKHLNALMLPTQQKISKIGIQLQEARQLLIDARKKPRVSDHAVIRFLERHYGFDFEKQRGELMTSTVKAAMQLGATRVKCHGYKLVLEGNTVVTVID